MCFQISIWEFKTPSSAPTACGSARARKRSSNLARNGARTPLSHVGISGDRWRTATGSWAQNSMPSEPSAGDPASEPKGGLPLQRKLPLLILALLALVLAVSLVISYFTVRRAAEVAAGVRLSSLSKVL